MKFSDLSEEMYFAMILKFEYMKLVNYINPKVFVKKWNEIISRWIWYTFKFICWYRRDVFVFCAADVSLLFTQVRVNITVSSILAMSLQTPATRMEEAGGWVTERSSALWIWASRRRHGNEATVGHPLS